MFIHSLVHPSTYLSIHSLNKYLLPTYYDQGLCYYLELTSFQEYIVPLDNILHGKFKAKRSQQLVYIRTVIII